MPMTIETIQAGKKEPSTFRMGSQLAPRMPGAPAARARNVTRIPGREYTTDRASSSMRLTARRVSGFSRARPGSPRLAAIAAALWAGALAGGCAEWPVAVRDPYAAAPPASSAPWRPPPRAAADRPLPLAGRGAAVPVDPNALYGLADLIDF